MISGKFHKINIPKVVNGVSEQNFLSQSMYTVSAGTVIRSRKDGNQGVDKACAILGVCCHIPRSKACGLRGTQVRGAQVETLNKLDVESAIWQTLNEKQSSKACRPDHDVTSNGIERRTLLHL
jgi:hypothetical protein